MTNSENTKFRFRTVNGLVGNITGRTHKKSAVSGRQIYPWDPPSVAVVAVSPTQGPTEVEEYQGCGGPSVLAQIGKTWGFSENGRFTNNDETWGC